MTQKMHEPQGEKGKEIAYTERVMRILKLLEHLVTNIWSPRDIGSALT